MGKKEEHKPIKIDVSLIPKEDVQNLCRTFLTAIKKFYEDPENEKRFEEWKKEKEKEEQEKCTAK